MSVYSQKQKASGLLKSSSNILHNFRTYSAWRGRRSPCRWPSLCELDGPRAIVHSWTLWQFLPPGKKIKNDQKKTNSAELSQQQQLQDILRQNYWKILVIKENFLLHSTESNFKRNFTSFLTKQTKPYPFDNCVWGSRMTLHSLPIQHHTKTIRTRGAYLASKSEAHF